MASWKMSANYVFPLGKRLKSFYDGSMRYIVLVWITIVLFISFLVPSVIAQEFPSGLHVAKTFSKLPAAAVEGDIVSVTDHPDELELSRIVGDARVYGVLHADPVVVYRTTDEIPVVSAGEALVNITTIGGPIMRGDVIVSSEIPGKGQKAPINARGYMIGYALESFGEQDGEPFIHEGKQLRKGKIRVLLAIRPIDPLHRGSLLHRVQSASLDFLNGNGDRWIRYLIALLIVSSTIYFSYRTFQENVAKGIEGIGRNPLAKTSIQAMVTMNMILIGVLCIGGIALGVLIIVSA